MCISVIANVINDDSRYLDQKGLYTTILPAFAPQHPTEPTEPSARYIYR